MITEGVTKVPTSVSSVAFSVTKLKYNQYVALLVRQLEEREVFVRTLSVWDVLFKKIQVIHVHWPEHFLRRLNKLVHVKLLVGFLIALQLAKVRRIPIVWTVHNVWPHDVRVSQKILKWFFKKWVSSVDACIYMSASSRVDAESAHPGLGEKPCVVIPHGHYKDLIPDGLTKASARKDLGITVDSVVLSHCGIIRSYKNTLKLVQLFSQLEGDDLRLIIAGKCTDKSLSNAIEMIALSDSRIRYWNHFLTESEIAAVTVASDLAVLPYTRIANSGVALYALSAFRPILGPRQGVFIDLQQQLGEWVTVYDGDFNLAVLAESVMWLRQKPKLHELDLDYFDWKRIGEETRQFYQLVIDRFASQNE